MAVDGIQKDHQNRQKIPGRQLLVKKKVWTNSKTGRIGNKHSGSQTNTDGWSSKTRRHMWLWRSGWQTMARGWWGHEVQVQVWVQVGEVQERLRPDGSGRIWRKRLSPWQTRKVANSWTFLILSEGLRTAGISPLSRRHAAVRPTFWSLLERCL